MEIINNRFIRPPKRRARRLEYSRAEQAQRDRRSDRNYITRKRLEWKAEGKTAHGKIPARKKHFTKANQGNEEPERRTNLCARIH